jgi:cation transport ATPase
MSEATKRVRGKITFANVLTLFKALAVGIILFEIYRISQIIGIRLGEYIVNNNYASIAKILIVVYAIIILFYILYRGAYSDVKKIIRSKRLDVILMLLVGVSIDFIWGGIGTGIYQNLINKFTNYIICILY